MSDHALKVGPLRAEDCTSHVLLCRVEDGYPIAQVSGDCYEVDMEKNDADALLAKIDGGSR